MRSGSSRRWSKSAAFMGVLIALVLFIATCGSPAEPTPKATPTATAGQLTPTRTASPTPVATPTSVPATATPAVEQPRRGGSVTTAEGADTPGLDVTKSTSWQLQWSLSSTYNKLVRYKPTGFESTTVESDLAEGWTISPDGKTYTFKLRKGVKWQNLPPVNGRELTAADVVWTINWGLDPKNKTYLADYYKTIEKATAPDPYTVVLTTKSADPEFLLTQAHGFNKTLAHEVFEKFGNFDTVVGTGAWIFDEWTSGVALKFKKNPNYFKMGFDGKPRPYLDAWKMVIIPDEAAREAALISQQIDFGPQCCGVALNNLKKLQSAMPNYSWQEGWRANSQYVWMNNAAKPLDDVRVRQAIRYAVHWKSIADVSTGAGYSRPESFIPRAVEKYSLPVKEIEAFQDENGTPQGIEKAKQLMKEAGYERGFSTTVILPGGPAGMDQASVLKDLLAKINIDVKILPLERVQARAKWFAGDYELAIYSATTGPYPSFWLHDWFYSKGSNNVFKYKDPKYDAMVDRFMAEFDEPKRIQIAHEAERYLWTTMPSQPMYYNATYFAISKRMKNYLENWSVGLPALEETWVTK